MQPQLTTREGEIILLQDDIYEAILRLIKKNSVEPVASIEELEAEFADLFTTGSATLDDLLAEHAQEFESEERKLEHFR